MRQNKEPVFIDKKSNNVIVSMNAKIYNLKAIEQACNDYCKVCKVKKSVQNDTATIELKPKAKGLNLDTLGFEFFNYVLAVQKNQ